MTDLFGHNTGAVMISDCGRYRYRLTRGQAPFVAWLMLNPSTADAQADDRTIRRCCKFANSWGYGGIIVVNIYPFRSSSPAECKRWTILVDRHEFLDVLDKNRRHIEFAAQISAIGVAAFGAGAWNLGTSALAVQSFCQPIHCLGTNKDGWPLHPMARGKLRVPDDQTPQPWEWPENPA